MPTVAQCQRSHDALLPPEYDDSEALTPEQAAEDAEAELMATPAAVADTLALLCDPGYGQPGAPRPGCRPVDVQALCAPELDGDDAPTHALMAVAMLGNSDNALRALLTLRERVRAALHADIQERAAELLAADPNRLPRANEVADEVADMLADWRAAA